MPDSLHIQLNGEFRDLSGLTAPATLAEVVETLGLKADRIAVECNGEIAPRTSWQQTTVQAGDKLEIVHFVGGGCA